jgi:hypothetical protein
VVQPVRACGWGSVASGQAASLTHVLGRLLLYSYMRTCGRARHTRGWRSAPSAEGSAGPAPVVIRKKWGVERSGKRGEWWGEQEWGMSAAGSAGPTPAGGEDESEVERTEGTTISRPQTPRALHHPPLTSMSSLVPLQTQINPPTFLAFLRSRVVYAGYAVCTHRHELLDKLQVRPRGRVLRPVRHAQAPGTPPPTATSSPVTLQTKLCPQSPPFLPSFLRPHPSQDGGCALQIKPNPTPRAGEKRGGGGQQCFDFATISSRSR